jgi:hypothetical protein
VIAEGRDGSFVATFGLSGANRDIQSVRMSVDGLNWGTAHQVISEDGVYICNANIAQTGDTDFLLVYEECMFGTGVEVPIKQVSSSDDGVSWGEPSDAITSLSSFGSRSDVAVAPDGTLWLLHTSDEDLYYTTSTDGGATWAPSTQWTDNTGAGNNPGDLDQDFQPKLSIVDDNPFAVFVARRGNDWFHMFYGTPGVSTDPLVVSAVEKSSAEIPNALQLSQNYPNPFNPSTRISFAVSDTGPVSLVVYDLMGRERMRLVDATLNRGMYEVTLDGSVLASGSYVYQLISGGESSERMLTLLK